MFIGTNSSDRSEEGQAIVTLFDRFMSGKRLIIDKTYLCKARQFYLSMGKLCNWFKNWLVKTSGQSIQILAQHNNKPLIIRDGSLINQHI